MTDLVVYILCWVFFFPVMAVIHIVAGILWLLFWIVIWICGGPSHRRRT